MSRRAALYLRAEGGEPLAVVSRWLTRARFLPWEALPKGYRPQTEEAREFLHRPAGDGPWAVLAPEAFQHLHRFAWELCQPAYGLTVLAATDTWDGHVHTKLYRGGQVLLKVGEDQDLELSYHVPVSEPRHFDEVAAVLGLAADAQTRLQTWGRAVASGPAPTLDDVVDAFELPTPPPRFTDGRAAGWDYVLYLSKRSPLILNA